MISKRRVLYERIGQRAVADLTPLSINELVDLYFSSSVHVATHYRAKDRKYRCWSMPMVIDGRRVTLRQAKIKGIIQQLGLDDTDLTTHTLKQCLEEVILSRTKPGLLVALTHMLNKHRTLSTHMSPKSLNPIYTISDKSGLLRKLFDRLGISYKERANGYVLRITEGSFFINGKWLHIG